MINIGICDDDIAVVRLLASHIQQLSVSLSEELECRIHSFNAATQVLDFVKEHPLHILFLDIDMPEMNGFELAQRLNLEVPPPIILFVSAHNTLVYESFCYTPFRFLRKNMLHEELEPAFQKALEHFIKRTQTAVFDTVEGLVTLRLSGVLYIESVKNYYDIHLSGKTVYRCRGTMFSLEKKLPAESFFRIHTGYWINMEMVKQVFTDQKVKMADNTELPISYRHRKQFKESYSTFCRRKVTFS